MRSRLRQVTERIGDQTASPRVAAVLLFVGFGGALVYLPGIGIGVRNAPNVLAIGSLVASTTLAAACTLCDPATRSRFTTRTGSTLLALFTLWMGLAGLQSDDRPTPTARYFWFASILVLATHAVTHLGARRALRVAVLALGTAVLAGVLLSPFFDAEVDLGLYQEPFFPWPRLRGVFSDHSVMGFSGAMLVIFGVTGHRLDPVPMNVFATGVGGLAILASHNRSAMLTALIVLSVWLLRRGPKTPLIAAGLGAVAALFLLIPGVTGLARRNSSDVVISYWQEERIGVLTGREEIWAEAIRLWLGSPFSGNGNGSFERHTEELLADERITWEPGHAHNVALEVLVDQGIVGLALLGAVVAYLVRHRRLLVAGAGPLLAAVALHGLVEATFYANPSMPWVILCIVVASVRSTQLHREGDSRDRHDADRPDDESVVEPVGR